MNRDKLQFAIERLDRSGGALDVSAADGLRALLSQQEQEPEKPFLAYMHSLLKCGNAEVVRAVHVLLDWYQGVEPQQAQEGEKVAHAPSEEMQAKAKTFRQELQRIKTNPNDSEERALKKEVLDNMSDPELWHDDVALIQGYGAKEFSKGFRAAPAQGWNEAIEAAKKFVLGRLAGRSEGSDLWLEIHKIANGLERLARPSQAQEPDVMSDDEAFADRLAGM